MKNILKTIIVLFSIFGLASLIWVFVAMRKKDQEEFIAEKNCGKLKTGINIEDAIEIMSQGVSSPSYSYEITFKDKRPSEYYVVYEINGGSSLVKIYFDKDTGEVIGIDCPRIK